MGGLSRLKRSHLLGPVRRARWEILARQGKLPPAPLGWEWPGSKEAEFDRPESDDFVQPNPMPYDFQGSTINLFAYYSPQKADRLPDPIWEEACYRLEPRLPGWRDSPEFLRFEINLAKHYGIRGFVVEYEYGNSDGSSRFLRDLVRLADPSFQFCLSFALDEHGLNEGAKAALAKGILTHPHYKTLHEKPVVILESNLDIGMLSKHALAVRSLLEALDPYLILGARFSFDEDPREYGFNGVIQLAPHTVSYVPYRARWVFHATSDAPPGRTVYSYASIRRLMGERPLHDFPDFEAAYAGWNSEKWQRLPAYGYASHLLFHQWITNSCMKSAHNAGLPEPLVLLKSWNDWNHGCAVFPNQRYGYKSLQALKDGLEDADQAIEAGRRKFGESPLRFNPPEVEAEETIPRNPIVVYQMGKVGSTTISNALSSMNWTDPVIHTHALHNLDAQIALALREQPDPTHTVRYLQSQKKVRDWIERSDGHTMWNVITIIRDPVARNSSCFFQNLDLLIPDFDSRWNKGDLSVEELQDYFLGTRFYGKLCDWYSDVFEPVFHFKLDELPYEDGRGYVIAEKGSHRLLVLRNEDISHALIPALSEFLGRSDTKMVPANVTSEKTVGSLYNEFRKLTWPPGYVEDMYNDPIVRRFYSEEEIAALIGLHTRGTISEKMAFLI